MYGCDEKDEELELLHDDLSMENINAKLGISRDKVCFRTVCLIKLQNVDGIYTKDMVLNSPISATL